MRVHIDRNEGLAAFAITRISEADRNILAVCGEVDLAAEREFLAVRQQMVGDCRPLVIDCTGVTFIDCSGLRIIVNALGGHPHNRLANVPARMSRLMRMVGQDRVGALRDRDESQITRLAGLRGAHSGGHRHQ